MIYRPFEYKGAKGVVFVNSETAMWFHVLNDVSYGTYSDDPGDEKERADVMEQHAKKSIDMVTANK